MRAVAASAAIAAASLLLLVAGCRGGDGGGGPAPTPEPAMEIQPVLTISGTTTIERGECVGFRIQTENFSVDDPRVFFSGYELDPGEWWHLDFNTVQVGFPCFFTPLNLPLGALEVKIVDGPEGETLARADAFEVVETIRVDLGDAPAVSDAATEVDANALQVSHDIDVYGWSAPSAGTWVAEVVVGTGASAVFLPYQYLVTKTFGASLNGHEIVLLPVTGTGNFWSEVADHRTAGGATGFDYRFRVGREAGAPVPAGDDVCEAAVPGTLGTAGLFVVDLATAGGELNPGGAASCADRHVFAPAQEGEGARGVGPERVLAFEVPAGATFVAAATGPATDVVLYLLPDLGCVVPSLCLAAADTFGSPATETLRWRNSAGSPVIVRLVVDEYGGADSDPGPVLVLVRLDS